MNPTARLIGTPLAAALLCGALLAGCSDDGPSPQAGATSPTTSATPYLPVPDGVDLTAQGSRLQVGDTATVAYRPRQGQVGVLSIDVTRLERTTTGKAFAGWQLTRADKQSNPYFVRARVKNVGRTDLGGDVVPLYIVDGTNTLLRPTRFASEFKPCPSAPFPRKFRPGDTANVCLVYLAPRHGRLVAVSFRPEETFNPITWTGEVQRSRSGGGGTSTKGHGGHGGDGKGH